MRRLLCFFFATALFAADPKVIPLWPGTAPGSENWTWEENETPAAPNAPRAVFNVTHPTLTAFLPDPSISTGTAMIICPGGGFRRLMMDYEGTDCARWLNSIGVAAFVLKYRLMRSGDPTEREPAVMAERRKLVMPLEVDDGQQAIRVIRAHAAEWHIRPDRVGIMGFSAGGFVTVAVALKHDASSRPNFAAPIYPFVPEDVVVPADAPPLFIVHADDDKTLSSVDHSIRLYTAWKKAGIPAELHIYSRGGHGFGMLTKGLPVDSWTERLRGWLDAQGLLKRP